MGRQRSNSRDAAFLVDLERHLKPLNTPDDLIALGLFRSKKTMGNARWKGIGPDFIRVPGTGIRYPKEAVLSWLARNSVQVEQVQPDGR